MRVYFSVVALWLAYAVLTLYNPHTGVAKYNLTPSQTNILQLTVIIPILAIWLVATYGALRFRNYAQTIKSSPDGAAASNIAQGLLCLIAYLIVSTLISSIAPFAVGTSLVSAAVVIRNHLPILIALTAFTLTYMGSVKLISLSGVSAWSTKRFFLFLLPYCSFAGLFTWLFFSNPDLHTISPTGLPAFVLPRNALLFAYVLPYLTLWFLGCLSALNIYIYARAVKGSIYRSAFLNLALGIISVVLFTIIVQLLSTISASLAHFNLASILLLVYVIIILDAVGYAFVAKGARKLSRIEEVQ